MTEPLEALKAGHSLDFSVNDRPRCPHCGEYHEIDRNEWYELYDDNDSHEVDCPSCNLPFRVVSHARYSFSTDEQDEDWT